jgi:transcriptional regulator with XRE-family HTH domain
MNPISNFTTDPVVLSEVGRRLAQLRLNQNLSQAALAEKAGITRLTVHNIESGSNANFTNIIRFMRGLGILGNLDAIIPELAPSPIQQADAAMARRKRAGKRRQPPSGEPE